MSTDAIIFDLDDTLYAERDYAFSGFAHVARTFQSQLGDPAYTQQRLRELFHTDNRHRVFNVLLDQLGLNNEEALLKTMIDAFRNHQPTLTLYPDAERALQRFSERCKLGIITDGPIEQQSAKLAALNVRNRVNETIMTRELGPEKGKPDPTSFELMAQRLGVPHSGCVYIADNASKDFVAPNRLGWLTLQVKRPEGVYADVDAASGGESHHAIHSLDEVDALLR